MAREGRPVSLGPVPDHCSLSTSENPQGPAADKVLGPVGCAQAAGWNWECCLQRGAAPVCLAAFDWRTDGRHPVDRM